MKLNPFNQNINSWGKNLNSVARGAMFRGSGLEQNPPKWWGKKQKP